MRFGILCDGRQLERWQRECLEQLAALPEVVAGAFLVSRRPPESGAAAGGRLFRRLQRAGPDSPSEPVGAPEWLLQLPVIEVDTGSASAAATGQAPGWAAAVRAERLDFILSFSTSPVARRLGELVQFGVWAFEFGDWERFRGAAPGFWEVYCNAPLSGCVLARLRPEADTVIPLRRGFLNTRSFSYGGNRDQLLRRFTCWPAQVCRQILDGDVSCLNAAPLRSQAAARTTPGNCRVLWFGMKMLVGVATRGIRSLLQSDHWNIGIVERPIREFLDPAMPRPPVRWLQRPRAGEFVADPFGLWREGRLTVLCEHLDYRDGVGRIAALEPLEPAEPLNRVPVQIGPVPPVHLSYPFIFEHDGRLLCIPETSAAREVAVYALERFPDRWRKLATLIEDRAVVDATVFRHGGYWWLAAAADGPQASVGADLHLWFAEDPLGPWRAHPGNPVKIDVRSSRPAGAPFVVDGVLYRPSQDSSLTYGARVVINRIDVLTPTRFAEEPVAFVEPDPAGPYPDGLHTLSAVGDITVIDGKRLAFSPPEFRRMVLRMLNRRLRRFTQLLRGPRGESNTRRHNSA